MMTTRITASVLAALVGLAGCVYTDGINSRPRVQLELDTDIGLIYVGEQVWVTARDTTDPDGDVLTYEFSIEHDGSADSPQPVLCAESMQPWELCFEPGAKVTYTVTVTVTDAHGAVAFSDPLEIHVNNRVPEAQCRIDTFPKPNNHFIVGRHIWMTGVESFDPDPGETLYYWWEERSRPANSSTADFVMQPSDLNGEPAVEERDATQLLVIPDAPGSYEVGLRVADGPNQENLSNVCQLFFEVDPDEEPCIASTTPDYSTGTLVFDRFDVRRLEVTEVIDDQDPYPGDGQGEAGFVWQLEEHPGAGFAEIPGYGFSYLDIDGMDFALNQQIRVRVIATDRASHDLSSCPVDGTTCALRAGCFQWITWDIEFR